MATPFHMTSKTIPFLLLTVLLLLFLWNKTTSSFSSSEETELQSTEKTLEQILQKMDQVGEVRVFLNKGESSNETSNTPSFEAIFAKEEKTSLEIQSVLIVAEGAENPHIKRLLKETVANLFLLPEHRIIVTQMTRGKSPSES
ncbi:hypothetical protein [Paenisporosarcina cavernae]|uniref:Stage III sporulation protein AG n=1 Tax=Paenisporosarcina cavernae TaxID=2320858 RepID=A0A385YRY5_9BACL|nr:hypothetical protein [Paenisporosarcina cavernae]AYC29545.1 hypothetical protein D3873_06485 [Paenisporosarcina cavernae]